MTTGTLKDKLYTGKQMTTGTQGILMMTGTKGHNYNGDAGGHGGYISNDGDTGNRRLAITINKAQGQSLES